MANKSVFASTPGRLLPAVDAVNRAGAPAYAYKTHALLAQLAMTGTFGDLFYQDAGGELQAVLDAAGRSDPEFLARTAVYAGEKGHMKDMPAFLLAVLASRDTTLFARAFPRVVTNGRMLRTFVQIMRSGRTGRKSLGSRPKAMVAGWLNAASDGALLRASVGNDPSLSDVICMVHPKPTSKAREAFYAWLIGKPCDVALLPKAVRDYMAFQESGSGELPDVPFQMLTHMPLGADEWAAIAMSGSWQMLRQNLNTFLRRGAFGVDGVADHVACVLSDPLRIAKARVFPYQLMTTFQALSPDMPDVIRQALHDAMELAVGNVPRIGGDIVVCPDVSGSMASPVTGFRKGATTATRFIDIAALVAAAFLRRNPATTVLPFEHEVRDVRLEARDTILTNARRLAALGGGGTNCSAPLDRLIEGRRAPDLVVFVSDNQSWVDAGRGGRGTAMLERWQRIRLRNPKARLVCIDIAPYGTTQARQRDDILNIGGFSDTVFDQVAAFAEGRTGPSHWVGEIERMEL